MHNSPEYDVNKCIRRALDTCQLFWYIEVN